MGLTGVTLFDLGAGLILLVSGIVGFVRGATREVTTVVAFVLAAVLSVLALRFTGPIARHAIHKLCGSALYSRSFQHYLHV